MILSSERKYLISIGAKLFYKNIKLISMPQHLTHRFNRNTIGQCNRCSKRMPRQMEGQVLFDPTYPTSFM